MDINTELKELTTSLFQKGAAVAQAGINDIRYNPSTRRQVIGAGGKVAAGAGLVGGALYLASRVPRVYAQKREIPVGILQVPVTLDGQISEGEYPSSDSSDNLYDIYGQRTSFKPEAHLYVKNDSTWTYFGFDSPTDHGGTHEGFFRLSFDTQKSGKWGESEPGVYSLRLDFKGSSAPTEVKLSVAQIGQEFMNVFKRGQDYDWQSVVGPSPLSSEPHRQFEVKILTEILRKHYSTIGFCSGVYDSNRNQFLISDQTPGVMWIDMTYKDIPVPELSLPQLGMILATTSAAVLVNRARTNKASPRRDFIREVPAYTLACILGLAPLVSNIGSANAVETLQGNDDSLNNLKLELAEQDKINNIA